MAGRWGSRAALAVALVLGGCVLAAPAVRAATGTPSTGYQPMPPVRVFDSRIGLGGVADPLRPGVERSVPSAGLGGVPANATRVAVRLTFFDAVSAGELRVHPCAAYDPNGLVLLELVPSLVDTGLDLVPLVGGAFCVTATARTNLVIDVEGYEQPGGGGLSYVQTTSTLVVSDVSVAAGTTLTVPVVGAAGVPANAGAVSATLVAEGTGASPGFLTMYPCDVGRPLASTLNYPVGHRYLTAAVGVLSASGSVCIYAQATATVRLLVHGYWASGATPTPNGPLLFKARAQRAPGFVAVPPRRLFDTRSGAPVTGGTAYVLALGSLLPPSATDVVMNVTVTEPVGAGYVTVYPCDAERPTVSNLNVVAHQTAPNLVTVSLGEGATVCLFASVTAHLLADLAGWYEIGGGDGLVPVTPTRLFDTRQGPGLLAAGSTYELDLTGRVGADASAVVMNVTVTGPTAAGFVTVYPCQSARPTASNLNFVAGQTVPNLVTVSTGTDRRVCFYTSGSAHLLADLAAWYAPSSIVGYYGLDPSRLFDTRDDGSRLEGGKWVSQSQGPGAVDSSEDWVVAMVLNVTAVGPVGAGFVTAYPCADGLPTASNVNFVKGDVVPNLVVVRVDGQDEVCFYANQTTDLVVDRAGYFSEHPLLAPVNLT